MGDGGSTGISVLNDVVSAMIGWLGDISAEVASNDLMLIGIAAGALSTAVSLFMRLTGQRRGRRR